MSDSVAIARALERHFGLVHRSCAAAPTDPGTLFYADEYDFMGRRAGGRMGADGRPFVSCNLAVQQNHLRALCAYSRHVRDGTWRRIAGQLVSSYLRSFCDSKGLPYWGGHAMVDLASHRPMGVGNKPLVHELKGVLPYYDLWQEVNPRAFSRYVDAFWAAHLKRAVPIELSRHGAYDDFRSAVWGCPMQDGEPFRSSAHLSFRNCAVDLIYAAAKKYQFTGDGRCLAWASHLCRQYERAKDPRTGLGAYMFTTPACREADAAKATLSAGGDRAAWQLGGDFGGDAREGKVIRRHEALSIYRSAVLLNVHLSELLGAPARGFLERAHQGISAFVRAAFCHDTGTFRPLLANGTSLAGYILPKDGYYGPAGLRLEGYAPDSFFLPILRVALAAGDDALWRAATVIGERMGLGHIGERRGDHPRLHAACASTDVDLLCGMILLHQNTGRGEYLACAHVIAGNLLTRPGRFGVEAEGGVLALDWDEPFVLAKLLQAAAGEAFDRGVPYLGGHCHVDAGTQSPDFSRREAVTELHTFNP